MKMTSVLVAGAMVMVASVGCEEKKTDSATKAVTDAASKTGDAIKDGAAKTGDMIKEGAEKTGEAVKDGAQAVADAAKKAKDALLATTNEQVDGLKPQITSLKEKAAGLPELVKSQAATAVAELEKEYDALAAKAAELKTVSAEKFDALAAEVKAGTTKLGDQIKSVSEKFKM